MSAGPAARRQYKSLLKRVRSTKVLVAAWHAIRRNAETSQQEETKRKARKFGEDLPKNLRILQTRLLKGYVFAPAYGATPPKGAGKAGKRLVVAPLEDRIVQRAILDVLQDARDINGVQRVLNTPTSIGGIRGRGVEQAISLYQARVDAGDSHVAGSDISGFFTKIPRDKVIEFLVSEGVEPEFTQLVQDALTVELSNADKLSADDLRLFPTGDDGVAQGCPLSALAGNIVLEEFDIEMNQRGITCIRYIDDFLIIGKSRRSVTKAMQSAKSILNSLKMDIYDPEIDQKKAFLGTIQEGHVFLGYKLIPNEYPPSDAASAKILKLVTDRISKGQASIVKAISGRTLTSQDRCYAQTLVDIDNTLRGWRASLRASNCPDVFKRLDSEIDRRLGDFRSFHQSKIANRNAAQRRRAERVSLLAD